MAKKKIKKVEGKVNYDKQIEGLSDLIVNTNKRIDRLVNAIDKSKRVRGI